MPLTDAAIRKAKPSEKTRRLFDGGGLYVELTPAGGKLWRLKYRHDGKEKRIGFGAYPDVGLAEARDTFDLRSTSSSEGFPALARSAQALSDARGGASQAHRILMIHRFDIRAFHRFERRVFVVDDAFAILCGSVTA